MKLINYNLLFLLLFITPIDSNSISKNLLKGLGLFKNHLNKKLFQLNLKKNYPLHLQVLIDQNGEFLSQNNLYFIEQNSSGFITFHQDETSFSLPIEEEISIKNNASTHKIIFLKHHQIFPQDIVLKYQAFHFTQPQSYPPSSLKSAVKFIEQFNSIPSINFTDQYPVIVEKLSEFNLPRLVQGALLGSLLGGPKLYGVFIGNNHFKQLQFGFILEKINFSKQSRSLKDLIRDQEKENIYLSTLNSLDLKKISKKISEIIHLSEQEKILMIDPDFYIDFNSFDVKVIDTDLFIRFENPQQPHFKILHKEVVLKKIHEFYFKNHYAYLFFVKGLKSHEQISKLAEEFAQKNFDDFLK